MNGLNVENHGSFYQGKYIHKHACIFFCQCLMRLLFSKESISMINDFFQVGYTRKYSDMNQQEIKDRDYIVSLEEKIDKLREKYVSIPVSLKNVNNYYDLILQVNRMMNEHKRLLENISTRPNGQWAQIRIELWKENRDDAKAAKQSLESTLFYLEQRDIIQREHARLKLKSWFL